MDGSVSSTRGERAAALPHNLEAEQFLLGAILLDNDLIERVDGFLRAEHFYDPVHRRIFEVSKRLIDRGLLADPVVLKNHFAAEGSLKDLGGESYLIELAQAAPSLSAIADYGRAIFESFQRRGLIQIGHEIITEAAREDIEDPPREQIERAEQNLYGLAEVGRFGGGFRAFREAAAGAIEIAALAHRRDGHVSGIATHIRDLDRRLGGLQSSDLIIVAGRPGMGKTALGTNIAFNVANARRAQGEGQGGVVGFFSLEMSTEQLAQRIISGETDVPADRVRRGDIETHEYESLVDKMRELEDTPLHIDDTGALSIAALAARARRLKRHVGLDLIVIDYVQLMTPSGRKKADNRVQEVTEITQGLKALAKELNVPVIGLSQLSRAVEQRDDKRPQLSDLRESGSIEQDADIVLFVFREEYYHRQRQPGEDSPEYAGWAEKMEAIHGKAEVIIAKQRHGPTGTVDLHYNGPLTKFSDLARPDDSLRMKP